VPGQALCLIPKRTTLPQGGSFACLPQHRGWHRLHSLCCVSVCSAQLSEPLSVFRAEVSTVSALTQGMYDIVARRMDCCLGWLPSSFLPPRIAPEQQCFAVLSLAQLLLVWALPIVILSRRALRVRAFVSGKLLQTAKYALAAASAHA